MRASIVKTYLSTLTVREVLESLGYEFDRSGKFKLREECTPSSAINPRSARIKDFGSDWNGDLFDLLQAYHGMDFKEAVEYVAGMLGLSESDIEAEPAPTFNPPPATVPRYDINRIYERFRRGRSDLVRRIGKDGAACRFADELIPKPLQEGIDKEIVNQMVGFDTLNDAFTVSLLKGNEVKAVTIRRADRVKWKTYGKKTHIATHFNDDPLAYVVYGMKEILLLQAHGWPLIGFQSDGIAKSIERNEQAKGIKEAARGKVLVLLLDHDDSCRATVEPLRRYFNESIIVAVDFQKLLFDQNLPKGYDFYDFARWCKDIRIARWMIKDYIEMVPPHDRIDAVGERMAA